ncbi:hypothetical protein THAOC_33730 [Thalassiosira oceanica]|uniref:Uncharacterized protein n=1 Tax=Thalassiosira oceanica TaxID=159749 RepID=K0REP2_THAOC|nr:hypothetical protein THAOC_33730 [Thalassiosira oceanica]|eukprot:EJK47541.1 hypothetical protein THAOC_33730 [Thalassiosira oceanica]
MRGVSRDAPERATRERSAWTRSVTPSDPRARGHELWLTPPVDARCISRPPFPLAPSPREAATAAKVSRSDSLGFVLADSRAFRESSRTVPALDGFGSGVPPPGDSSPSDSPSRAARAGGGRSGRSAPSPPSPLPVGGFGIRAEGSSGYSSMGLYEVTIDFSPGRCLPRGGTWNDAGAGGEDVRPPSDSFARRPLPPSAAGGSRSSLPVGPRRRPPASDGAVRALDSAERAEELVPSLSALLDFRTADSDSVEQTTLPPPPSTSRLPPPAWGGRRLGWGGNGGTASRPRRPQLLRWGEDVTPLPGGSDGVGLSSLSRVRPGRRNGGTDGYRPRAPGAAPVQPPEGGGARDAASGSR